ncbi:hypothetical protein T4A_6476 [Trichinella pseudospiralis]|uniref:Uncharacterized protein n=1 Tax=Trichinella pseudospiralis TaxID=6337 RepID=A0A0V1CTH2_TRIPS|nr:hypothetical protein T4A_549 [Trichinella pseudospiralis]KRY52613.1 hypothetical protein T4A_9570 [Trichinella pseudospiralis]KRY52884.1 hypothetical protein T4A_6476 [Trichinella pseudospiralis]
MTLCIRSGKRISRGSKLTTNLSKSKYSIAHSTILKMLAVL